MYVVTNVPEGKARTSDNENPSPCLEHVRKTCDPETVLTSLKTRYPMISSWEVNRRGEHWRFLGFR